jgi:CHASE2 domain-containing sensor protein
VSVKQQLFFVKRHKTFWLIISLITVVLIAELTGVLQRLNAPIFNYFNLWQSEKHSDVVVIEANDLTFEHDQLIYTLLDCNGMI